MICAMIIVNMLLLIQILLIIFGIHVYYHHVFKEQDKELKKLTSHTGHININDLMLF